MFLFFIWTQKFVAKTKAEGKGQNGGDSQSRGLWSSVLPFTFHPLSLTAFR
jgi:hypothetical protein